MPMLHLRVNGRSEDLPLDCLGLERFNSSQDVKSAVARHLDMPQTRLKDYTVELHPGGNVTVRPNAVFG